MTVRHEPDHNRFTIETDSGTAELEYVLKKDRIVYVHTGVPEGARGQDVGTTLVEHGLAYARENGLKVLPLCPFVKAYMEAHEETHDLLARPL
ncbi:MAG: GNAT family N-acetyltransferase [Bacteroidota bacterium]